MLLILPCLDSDVHLTHSLPVVLCKKINIFAASAAIWEKTWPFVQVIKYGITVKNILSLNARQRCPLIRIRIILFYRKMIFL